MKILKPTTLAVLACAACESENTPPEIASSILDQKLNLSDEVELAVNKYFTDPDGDTLSFDLSVASSKVVRITSVSSHDYLLVAVGGGTAEITARATDPDSEFVEQEFIVTVNLPPATSGIPEQRISVSKEVRIDTNDHFADPEGDALVYAVASSAPGFVTVRLSGREIVLSAVDVGTAEIKATATDPEGAFAEQTFMTHAINDPPEVVDQIPTQHLQTEEVVTFDLDEYFSDPNGDPLWYMASRENGNVYVATEGSILTVWAVGEGADTVTVTATDPDEESVTSSFEAFVQG